MLHPSSARQAAPAPPRASHRSWLRLVLVRFDDGVRRGGSPDLHASRGLRETAILAASAFHGLTDTKVPALCAHARPYRQTRFCARPSCRPRAATPRPTASSETALLYRKPCWRSKTGLLDCDANKLLLAFNWVGRRCGARTLLAFKHAKQLRLGRQTPVSDRKRACCQTGAPNAFKMESA